MDSDKLEKKSMKGIVPEKSLYWEQGIDPFT